MSNLVLSPEYKGRIDTALGMSRSGQQPTQSRSAGSRELVIIDLATWNDEYSYGTGDQVIYDAYNDEWSTITDSSDLLIKSLNDETLTTGLRYFGRIWGRTNEDYPRAVVMICPTDQDGDASRMELIKITSLTTNEDGTYPATKMFYYDGTLTDGPDVNVRLAEGETFIVNRIYWGKYEDSVDDVDVYACIGNDINLVKTCNDDGSTRCDKWLIPAPFDVVTNVDCTTGEPLGS